MQIESIDIKSWHYYCGTAHNIDGAVHIKHLKSLSVVQSKIGSYGIKIDNGKEYNTGEGGIFIAPSFAAQKITHHENPQTHNFKMRYVFIDAVINKKYPADDIFDFPVIPDSNAIKAFDADFDNFDKAATLCDKMSCLYQIIKHLLEISTEKTKFRNKNLYPIIEFIARNYMKNISVGDMAKLINMSESNLYASFKKAYGTSPVKYLTDYRLSVASEQLLCSGDSIKNIAESVGIPDQFYFSKLFRAKYASSPQKYRKETQVLFKTKEN